jgi:hypothetical protein
VKPAKRERCPLCGNPIDADDSDAVQVHGDGGLVHEGCIEERDDEPGLFQDPEVRSATGRDAASSECSVVELERQARAARRKQRGGRDGRRQGQDAKL